MSSYDIFGVSVMIAWVGLCVDQGWTLVLIVTIGIALFNFIRVWIEDDWKAKRS